MYIDIVISWCYGTTYSVDRTLEQSPMGSAAWGPSPLARESNSTRQVVVPEASPGSCRHLGPQGLSGRTRTCSCRPPPPTTGRSSCQALPLHVQGLSYQPPHIWRMWRSFSWGTCISGRSESLAPLLPGSSRNLRHTHGSQRSNSRLALSCRTNPFGNVDRVLLESLQDLSPRLPPPPRSTRRREPRQCWLQPRGLRRPRQRHHQWHRTSCLDQCHVIWHQRYVIIFCVCSVYIW